METEKKTKADTGNLRGEVEWEEPGVWERKAFFERWRLREREHMQPF